MRVQQIIAKTIMINAIRTESSTTTETSTRQATTMTRTVWKATPSKQSPKGEDTRKASGYENDRQKSPEVEILRCRDVSTFTSNFELMNLTIIAFKFGI